MFTGNCAVMFKEFKRSMMNEFEMSDMGLMHYYLGLEVVPFNEGIFMCQKKYIGEILDRFYMNAYNPVNTSVELGLKLYKDHCGKKVDSRLLAV